MEDLLWQRRQNEDFQHKETWEQIGQTPGLPTPVDNVVTDGAPVSDDDSAVSSVYSQHSEPEGQCWDDDHLDGQGQVHLPGPSPAPNIENEGAGPNVVPVGDNSVQAHAGVPEAAIPPAPNIERQTHGPAHQYPPLRWTRGADGKLEHANLCGLNSFSYRKLNREIFALTFGTKQIPPRRND